MTKVNMKVEVEKINVKVVDKIDLSKFEVPKVKHELKKKEVIVYPQEEIHFFLDKNKKVVGRSGSGKIAIISFDFKGSWVKDGEDWLCDVIKEEEHKLIVMPVHRTITADENFANSVDILNKLKENGFKTPFLKPKNAILYAQSK